MPFSSLQKKDFFGRQVELASLYKRVLQADSGQAQSIVLSGRRGIGKTELLKHLFGQLFLIRTEQFLSCMQSILRCCL